MLAKIHFQSEAGLITLLVFRPRRGGFVLERHCAGEKTEHRARRLRDLRNGLHDVPAPVVNRLIGEAMAGQ